MKIYILDEIFWNDTTTYTGEEIIVYPVELDASEIKKLEELGIKYTTNPDEVAAWISQQESIKGRDFGGRMVKENAIKLNIDWDKVRELKEKPMQNGKKK